MIRYRISSRISLIFCMEIIQAPNNPCAIRKMVSGKSERVMPSLKVMTLRTPAAMTRRMLHGVVPMRSAPDRNSTGVCAVCHEFVHPPLVHRT